MLNSECASDVWAATAGTLLFFRSTGTVEEGSEGSRGEPNPEKPEGEALGGYPAYWHLQFPVCLLEEPHEQGWGWTPSPQLPGGLERSSGHRVLRASAQSM